MVEAAPKKRWTPQEYLAMERESQGRHTYFRGGVFAMAGATRRHNLLAGNIAREIGNALRTRPCEVYQSDMRVKVVATGLYTYPDVTVVCGGPELEDDEQDTLLNPGVIVEVLSPSTESYDRGRKFQNYRLVPSLKDYVLVSQDEVLVEHFARHLDGSWPLRELKAGDRLRLPSLGCEVAIDEIYLKVFEPPGEAAESQESERR